MALRLPCRTLVHVIEGHLTVYKAPRWEPRRHWMSELFWWMLNFMFFDMYFPGRTACRQTLDFKEKKNRDSGHDINEGGTTLSNTSNESKRFLGLVKSACARPPARGTCWILVMNDPSKRWWTWSSWWETNTHDWFGLAHFLLIFGTCPHHPLLSCLSHILVPPWMS